MSMLFINKIIDERDYGPYTRTKFVHKLRIYFTFNKIFKENNYLKKTILDIGCNKGTYSIIFRSRKFDVDAFDICDLSPAINLAKKYNMDVNFFNMSAEDINLTKKYDFVFCSEVLEHLNNPEKALKSINKVCRKNTKIIISMPNVISIYGILKFIQEYISSIFNISKVDSHQKFPFLRVLRMFRKNRYDIKVLGSVYFLPMNLFEKFNLLISTCPIIKYFGYSTFYEVRLRKP